MIELDRVYWEKAQENLAAAESEYVNSRYNSCASRCYYACFQAAIYALSQAGIRPSDGQWGHAFVQAEFIGRLINRRKQYSAQLRPTLSHTYILRQTGDYAPEHVSEVRAARAVARAEQFLAAIGERG
ncbi:MAG: HEPN domain-containing protein [Chloroflexi bacterium]|nr:HEPN domain-containing protein [Chloroflexota bacterium]